MTVATIPHRGREFPTLGSASHPVSQTTQAQFFVTGPWVTTATGVQAPPQEWIHAKRMGTTTTACGQSALSWTKLWHVPFDQDLERVCPACVALVHP